MSGDISITQMKKRTYIYNQCIWMELNW